MKFLNSILIITSVFSISWVKSDVARMVCYYDSSNFMRQGSLELTSSDLEPALQYCNYLIYGYAGIDRETYQIKSLNTQLDINNNHYHTITELKRRHPQLRVLLSVGGDKDTELATENSNVEQNKYLLLLEDISHRRAFIDSAVNLLRTYNFDGIDLAWQFPKNRPKIIEGGFTAAWNTVKGWFTSVKPVDEKAATHKEQFTSFVRELRSALNRDGLMMTLTMLPNVNAALFVDIFTVVPNLEFVNLAAFDFHTPERDPKVADYPAPIYEMYERNPEDSINYQVQLWLNNTAPSNKINVGVPAYGRAWVMSKKSGLTGYPPVTHMHGAVPTSGNSSGVGLYSWPDVCVMLHVNEGYVRTLSRLRKVGDPMRRAGTYAYRATDYDEENSKEIEGIWIGYEEPLTAAQKASYVNAKGLGGVALFDLSMDDFLGICQGEKYPILRSIKYKL